MKAEELIKLKKYHLSTTQNGIIMPTKDVFDTKVKMTISLWPQINNEGGVDYLLGKGVGVELALLGTIAGREKNNCNFPYRSHSDFEIYNSLGYDKIPENKNFVTVFGSQEIYPKFKTKGLQNMPENLMDQTYEKVYYQRDVYLIPELEILFLDKYLKPEATQRVQGNDAILLLKEYKLDIEKIKDYFQRFVKEPNLKLFAEHNKELYIKQINQIINLYDYIRNYLNEEEINLSLENIIKATNNYINKFRPLAGYVNGVNLAVCPSNIQFIKLENQVDISEENKREISDLIASYFSSEEQKYDAIIAQIIDEYQRIYTLDKKSNMIWKKVIY